MFYLKIKDNKVRKKFRKFEKKILLKKFIYNNLLSYYYKKNKEKYSSICFQILIKKKKRISTKFVNRCILTNRSKSIRLLKISRLKTRELMSFGIIPGFKKAIW